MPPHVFAVDEERVRYGHFVGTAHGLELDEYRVTQLPADLFSGGPLGGAMRESHLLRAPLRDLMAQITTTVKHASLVLPDAWLRVAFTESEDLPRRTGQREEILRWKLRRLVPFRVEELRVDGAEVEPLAQQEQPRRFLLGFGIELLLRQLEESFGAVGVHIGQISNESLCLHEALREALRDVELGAVVRISPQGYSLVFSLRGDPVLHRFKTVDMASAGGAFGAMALRDLRMTRAFLAQQIPDVRLGRVLLACAGESAAQWSQWLEETFEMPAFNAGWEHLRVVAQPGSLSLEEAAPLIGAAQRKVA